MKKSCIRSIHWITAINIVYTSWNEPANGQHDKPGPNLIPIIRETINSRVYHKSDTKWKHRGSGSRIIRGYGVRGTRAGLLQVYRASCQVWAVQSSYDYVKKW